MVLKDKPKSKFLKVKCNKCNNEQIIFNKPASDIRCLVCESLLAESKGGEGNIKAKIIEELK